MSARVAIVSNFPRAQRVELYNEMARRAEIELRVFYLRRMAHERHWDHGPAIEHDHHFVRAIPLRGHLHANPGLSSAVDAFAPDLTLVTRYTSLGMQQLMYHQTLRRRPWVLWGERPTTRFPDDPVVPTDLLRRVAHRVAWLPLRLGAREIWGIGTVACAEYRRVVGPDRPVRNLPFFSDLDRFVAAGRARRPSPRIRFLFAGTLSVRKGADLVAAAAGRLLAEGAELELHVLGRGAFDEAFHALARRWPQRVIAHGFKQLDEVPPYHGNADVLLFPSRFDGWGMTLPEGMAAGLLAVSTRETGAAVDLIADGHNGLLLSAIDTEGLAAAMRRCLALPPGEIEAWGARARETALRYDHRTGATTFLAELHRACAQYAG